MARCARLRALAGQSGTTSPVAIDGAAHALRASSCGPQPGPPLVRSRTAPLRTRSASGGPG